jgi:hypothetical protein
MSQINHMGTKKMMPHQPSTMRVSELVFVPTIIINTNKTSQTTNHLGNWKKGSSFNEASLTGLGVATD